MALTLSSHIFENAPKYRCLSYVWGRKEWHRINVNGKTMYVSKNTLAFLKRMRANRLNEQYSEGYLWIDAICIDQHNYAEKGEQVDKMGAIYSRAGQVIAWLAWEWDRLGNAEDHGRNPNLTSRYYNLDGTDVDPETVDESVKDRYLTADDIANKEEPATDAIDYISKLVKALDRSIAARNDPWDGRLARCAFRGPELFSMLNVTGEEPVRDATTPLWRAIAVLLSRAWFQRTWIVQEAALAKSIVLIYGYEVFPADTLVQFCVLLHASGWFHRLMELKARDLIEIPPGWQMLVFRALQDVTRFQEVASRLGIVVESPLKNLGLEPLTWGDLAEQSVMRLLEFYTYCSRPLGVTEAADKVFAPLSLLRQVMEPYNLAGLVPPQPRGGYSMPVVELFTHFATNILLKSNSLALLSQVEDTTGRRVAGLPSWVPDFSSPKIAMFSWAPGLSFNAFPEHTAFCRISAGSKRLTLRGKRLDTLSCFDGVPEPLILNDIFFKRDLRPLLQACDALPMQYVNGEDRVEALVRTLVGDISANTFAEHGGIEACSKRFFELSKAIMRLGNTPNDDLPSVVDWTGWQIFEVLQSSSAAAGRAIPNVEELKSAYQYWHMCMSEGGSNISHAPAFSSPAAPYALAAGRVYPYRRVFCSKNGLIGLAPASSEGRDEIWFLSGADVPFILRPMSTTDGSRCFRLMGETYVHGYMRGETVVAGEDLEYVEIR